MFTVEMTVKGDMTYCVPLKQALERWIAEHAGDVARLPAAKLDSGQPDAALRLRVTWIEIPAETAWAAMTHAAQLLTEGCPRFLDDVALTVTAEIHDPDPDRRRPRGA